MLVADAGPLIAALAADDRNHSRCVDVFSSASRPILVPALVITEVAYFVATRMGTAAERAFAGSIRCGDLTVEPVEPGDWERIEQLLEQYEDLGLGIVDASVVAACERLGEEKLATLDHRHFGAVRPRHCASLELLP